MYYQEYPRSELAAGAQLAKVLRLIQVRPQHVGFENRLPKVGEDGTKNLRVGFGHSAESPQLREGYLDVVIALRVKFFAGNLDDEQSEDPDPDTENFLAKIELEYLLTFRTPKDPMPKKVKDEALPAFLKTTALTIAWPYLRHHVDHLASAAGIPFIMPVLCIDTSEADEEKETEPVE